MNPGTLAEQAEGFAAELTRTVQGVVGQCAPFVAVAVADHPEVSVRQRPATGIPLRVAGEPLLNLRAVHRCQLDSHDRYLAVLKSSVQVFPGAEAAGEPLFRVDYVRSPTGRVPVSHIQVHGEHPRLAEVMSEAGAGTRRGRRRARKVVEGRAPRLSELHLPTGGHRFRPCLEDILAVLVDEFGVEAVPGHRQVIEDGRERWRRRQTRAAVRDAPRDAIAELHDLGYEVTLRPGHREPGGQPHRLREL